MLATLEMERLSSLITSTEPGQNLHHSFHRWTCLLLLDLSTTAELPINYSKNCGRTGCFAESRDYLPATPTLEPAGETKMPAHSSSAPGVVQYQIYEFPVNLSMNL